jgi:hypothetical protein
MPYAIEVNIPETRCEPAPDEAELRGIIDRIRTDHGALRLLLDDVERACGAAGQISDRRCGPLRETIWELYLAFNAHLAFEEAYVAPILRKLDAWGELRAANMLRAHTDQRRAILELVEGTHYETKGTNLLVEQALALVVALRVDMVDEEASLADAGREPDVVVDQEDG